MKNRNIIKENPFAYTDIELKCLVTYNEFTIRKQIVALRGAF